MIQATQESGTRRCTTRHAHSSPRTRTSAAPGTVPRHRRRSCRRRNGTRSWTVCKAINTFADAPHEALEEAEGAFDDAAAHLASALAERRRALRERWREQDPETHAEELRIALRQYREITQRLIRT